eukprot:13883_4
MSVHIYDMLPAMYLTTCYRPCKYIIFFKLLNIGKRKNGRSAVECSLFLPLLFPRKTPVFSNEHLAKIYATENIDGLRGKSSPYPLCPLIYFLAAMLKCRSRRWCGPDAVHRSRQWQSLSCGARVQCRLQRREPHFQGRPGRCASPRRA